MTHETKRYGYDKDTLTALEAITEAQKIAFAPMIFQATIILRDSGILAILDNAGKTGCCCDEIHAQVELNLYSIQLLLDVGLSAKLIHKQGEQFILSKVGHYLLHDKMTRINMNFTQDVCYQGLFHLKESFEQEKPIGLSVFGEWPTIYPALKLLPEKAKNSWFAFDHFYSDTAFSAVFKYGAVLDK